MHEFANKETDRRYLHYTANKYKMISNKQVCLILVRLNEYKIQLLYFKRITQLRQSLVLIFGVLGMILNQGINMGSTELTPINDNSIFNKQITDY